MVIIADVKILYEGRDITLDIAPFLTSFTFTDNSTGKADDLSVALMDRDSVWLDSWMPTKGDKIRASIRENNVTLDCGAFEVDEVSYSMPPHVLTVKAVSCAVSKSSRWENHNQAWENTSLQEIASAIAGKSSLELSYTAPDYQFERREQTHIADLPFLEALCSSYGLSLKVSDGKLIIYDPDGLTESQSSCATITPKDKRLISARFTSKSAGTFRKARVRYHHPIKNETYEATYEDSDEEGSERELEIYERVDSQEQARQVAEGSLKSANSREITGSVTLKGSGEFVAGQTVTLDGFGFFSGKYFVDKAEHSLSSGWTVALSLKMGGESKKAAKSKKSAKQSGKAKTGGVILADDSRGY